MRNHGLALVLFLGVATASAAQERGRVANMGTCSSRAPRLWLVVDGASATDCSTGGGTSQVLCLCSGGAWAAVGSGGGSTANLPASFNFPPASPSSYDCEFSGSLCSGWSLYTASTAMDAGTISPISTASANPVYDFSTVPGWMMFQSDESTGTISGVKRSSVTLATNATIFFHVAAEMRDMAANEGAIGFGLFNASDSNEWVYLAIDSGTGAFYVYDGVNNNGSVGYTNRSWPGDLGYGTGGFYGAIVKESDTYHFWVWTSDLGLPHYLGSRVKTGVTTLDEFRFYFLTSNDSPRVIAGLDFVRYYSSATLALANQATTSALPQHVQDYDPDRKPASCAICEEFTDGALSQSWSWGNQGTSTETLELDRARINDSGTTRGSHRLVAAPAGGTDFTVTAKLEIGLNNATSDYAGLSVIHAGTLASPTAVLVFGINFNATSWNFLVQDLSNYTTWSATVYTGGSLYNFASPVYLQGRYAQSTKVFTMYVSFDGVIWHGGATKTLSNHPTYLGRFNDTDRVAYVDFFRVRTDANRDLAGE